MPEQESDPEPGAPESSSDASRQQPSRRKLTPELRRFLGPGRSWHDREAAKETPRSAEPDEEDRPVDDSDYGVAAPLSSPPVEPAASTPMTERRQPPSPPSSAVVPDHKISRVHEIQTLALIIGALILLGAAFYGGTKARHIKAFLSSRNKPEIANVDARKFPGLTADELVEQALAVERMGQWREAVERLLVAKRRNPAYRGIVFHAARLCYDNGDFDGADLLLERAVAFGDEVDTANYLRGLIASGRNDLVAAERFFQAALEAEPFTPGYYYYLGETLRKQHRSGEAIARYEQAAGRTVNEQDAILSRFKARLAKVETADGEKVQTEVNQKRSAGPLTLDWLLTDAALKIRAGEFDEAAALIGQARAVDQASLPTLFASCAADMLFTEAAGKHPEIADAMRVGGNPVAPSSSPTANP